MVPRFCWLDLRLAESLYSMNGLPVSTCREERARRSSTGRAGSVVERVPPAQLSLRRPHARPRARAPAPPGWRTTAAAP